MNNPTAKLQIGGTAGVDGIKFPDGTLQTTAASGGGGIVSGTGISQTETWAGTTVKYDDEVINLGFKPSLVILTAQTYSNLTNPIRYAAGEAKYNESGIISSSWMSLNRDLGQGESNAQGGNLCPNSYCLSTFNINDNIKSNKQNLESNNYNSYVEIYADNFTATGFRIRTKYSAQAFFDGTGGSNNIKWTALK